MGRFRLEIALVALLAIVLGGVVLAGPGDRGDPLAGGAMASPCEGTPRIEGIDRRDGDLTGVIGLVQELRSLEFRTQPDPVYLPPAEFSERVASMPAFRDGEAELLQEVLVGLAAIPADYDLERELTETTADGVIGFYDPETEELVVKGTGGADGLTGLERMTLVHELEHALADQAHGFRPLDDPKADEDALAAYRALVEGDAELVTEMYASQALGFADAIEIGLAAGPSAFAAFDAPHYLVRSLSFPYLEGATFACALYERGGWAAVDEAYANPPTTTSEILFPETYPAPPPVDPPDPTGPGRPWRHQARLSFGAADLLFLLEAPGGDTTKEVEGAAIAAKDWLGGELHVWSRGSGAALHLALASGGTDRLCRTIADWARAAFPEAPPREHAGHIAFEGGGRHAVVRCGDDGTQVRVGIGPSPRVARLAAA